MPKSPTLSSSLLLVLAACSGGTGPRAEPTSPPDAASSNAFSIEEDRHAHLVDDFEGSPAKGRLPGGWRIETFGDTEPSRFRLEQEQEQEQERSNGFLRIDSRAQAALLVRPVEVDLDRLPVLTWRWRANRIPEGVDTRQRDGDDCAARLFVTFAFDPESSTLTERLARLAAPPDTPGSALCYLWATQSPRFHWAPNAYSSETQMMALRSSPSAEVGEWYFERRNLREDYLAAFGFEPPRLTGIALMSDSDQTESVASADYDDIAFCKE